MPRFLTATANPGTASWSATASLVTTLMWDREIPVTGQGGNTRTTDFRPAQAITITAIYLYALTAPTTAGTYTLAVAGAGNNLLGAATFSLPTLVDNTYTSMALTGTTANLDIAANALVRFTFASNNGDLAGSGILLVVHYTTR